MRTVHALADREFMRIGPGELPSVEAELNYLAPMDERPRYYAIEPLPGTARSNAGRVSHRVAIWDARPVMDEFFLDREGFCFLDHRSAVSRFDDDDEIRARYYPESEELVKQATGADRVFIFDHTLRRRIPGLEDRARGPRQPATQVHVDHTAASGLQRVRDFFPDEASELLKGRVQVINLWRPICRPVNDAPLAICDARSVAARNLVPTDLVYADRIGEIYSVTYDPTHQWFYLNGMRPEEAILIKCFDSRLDRARFAPHTAFIHETAPANAPPRESIELRTLVFHAA